MKEKKKEKYQVGFSNIQKKTLNLFYSYEQIQCFEP